MELEGCSWLTVMASAVPVVLVWIRMEIKLAHLQGEMKTLLLFIQKKAFDTGRRGQND